jgi:hypothetical protein
MYRTLSLAVIIAISSGCVYPVGYEDGSTDATDVFDAPDDDCVGIGVQPDFADAATVRGQVMSPSGTVPVRSAIVELEVDGQAVWALTMCDGAFEVQLPEGSHDLHVAKGRYTAQRSLSVDAEEMVDLGSIRLEVPDVRIAVIDGIYDDIGAMVKRAGIPYDRIGRPSDLLDDPQALAQYDVVFSNCGSLPTTTDAAHYTPEQFANTREWLEAGGTLYTSDWEYELFEGAVPEALHFADDPKVGPVSLIEANVLDRDIQTILGKQSAQLRFNLNGWAVVESSDLAHVLVEGSFSNSGGDHPLAALMPVGEGKAIFTSFHNESQITDDMEILLYEMILSL